MNPEHKRWLVGKLVYVPEDAEFPWHVVRYGTVAEQGGLAFGGETTLHKTVEDACHWLSIKVPRDMDAIEERIAHLNARGATDGPKA